MIARIIFSDLRSHPIRHLLTAASLFIGITAIIAISVSGAIAESMLVGHAEQQSGRKPTFQASVTFGTPGTTELHRLADTVQDTSQHSDLSLALSVSATSVIAGHYPNAGNPLHSEPANVYATAGELDKIYRYPLYSGRWLSHEPLTSPLEIVLNKPAMQQFGSTGSHIGISSDTTPYVMEGTVVGIINDGSTESSIYLNVFPLLSNPEFLGSDFSIAHLLFHNQGLEEDQVRSLINDFRQDLRINGIDSPQRIDTVDSYREVVDAIQRGFLISAILALTVAMLGIINIGLASIKERAHELVIRRAIGATRTSIFLQVVGSAVLLAAIVALAAILLTAVLVMTLPQFFPADTPIEFPAYPVTAALSAISAAILTAIMGSLAPGITAMRIDPATALR